MGGNAKLMGPLCLVLFLLPTGASTSVRTVRQDGSGDFLTISAAYAAASACCDTIDVGPGTYTEFLYVTKRLSFIGSSGVEVTILDGEGSHQLMVFQAGSSGSVVSGFTFEQGMGGNGGALRVQEGADVTIRNCRFTDNVATYDGSAFFVRHSGSHLTIEDCTFTENHTEHNGGAGNIIENGTLDVTRCVFHGNSTNVVSGALAAHNAVMNVSNCLFTGNTSGDVAGALYYYSSGGSVRSNTFSGNSSPGVKAATVFIQSSPSVTVEKNIISNALTGYGLWDELSYMPHTCNIYWGNANGPVDGSGTLAPSEIMADPLYCDPATGDYTIAYESPAAPEHNQCGILIGAYTPACGNPIATLLQQYSVSVQKNTAVVRWTISATPDAPVFTVSRASESDDFTAVPNAAIVRSGTSYSYIDGHAEPGDSYQYRIQYEVSGKTEILFETETIKMPSMTLTLFQNYPNPFNPVTMITFYLPEPSDVRLSVYNVSGYLIASLVSARMGEGMHSFEWRGTDRIGNTVSSGTYFYRLQAGKKELVRKMILMR